MIEVPGVQPTARELRPVTRGWGGLHWWHLLYRATPFLGLWSLAVLIAVEVFWNPWLNKMAALIVVATSVVWVGVALMVNRVTLKAAREAPGGGMVSDWTIDETGLAFGTPTTSSRVRWEGIKAVREEKDRFVFLLSPAGSPFLPKRCLSEDQQAVLRQLVAEVTAANRLGRGVD